MIFFAAALAFLFSMCGVSCQFLLVRLLAPLLQDEVLCQSVTLGVYLLGMGLGASLVAWRAPRFALRTLFRAEILLAFLATILVPFCYVGFTGLELQSDSLLFQALGAQSKLFTLLFFQPLALALGSLAGMEIPLLSSWLDKRGGKHSITRVLAFSYFGAIGGAFLVSFLLVPNLDLGTASLVVGLIILVGASVLAFLPQEGRRLPRALPPVALLVALQFWVAQCNPFIEQMMLKTNYLELRLRANTPAAVSEWWHALKGFAPIERHQTPYQTIDLIPDHFLLGDPFRADFAMHINFQPQFTRDSVAGYHESMVFGGMILSERALDKALVLGGGDGLIVKELLRAGAKSITLVELDPSMLKLAREHSVLRALNGDSLRDPRVHVIAGDAFSFVRSSAEKFDGIYADLPFPTSYDLLKMYSVEFYAALRARLNEGGFLIFDAPLKGVKGSTGYASRPYPQEIFHATLKAAGWSHILAFGPSEPFLFASDQKNPPVFSYDRLPENLSGKTLFNLTALNWAFEGKPDASLVNSALKPRRIKW